MGIRSCELMTSSDRRGRTLRRPMGGCLGSVGVVAFDGAFFASCMPNISNNGTWLGSRLGSKTFAVAT